MNDVHNFEEAFDWFNKHLFGNKLRPCIITLQKSRRSRGYFSAKIFESKLEEGSRRDEIALNPEHFGRTDKDILSTLMHEQVHQWQEQEGHPSRGRYHNKEWAAKMEEVGLMPSHTGEPGGKRTGQSVSHYIIPDGLFDKVCTQLLETGFKVNWMAPGRESKKPRSKVKYSCPGCSANLWGKPGYNIMCLDCNMKLC